MKILNFIAYVVLVIGGLNWLSIGIFQFDFVAGIFGATAYIITRIIYILVGVSALYLTYISIAEKGIIDVCPMCENKTSVKNKDTI